MHTINFFAVPYAGSSANAVYVKWQKELGNGFKVIPLELPGRGVRTKEPFTGSMPDLIADLIRQILPVAHSKQPYVFYGHSMGTLVVYELLREIHRLNAPPPLGVFVSGRNTPDYAYPGPEHHRLSDSQLITELKKVSGTPPELFEVAELLQFFLPIIREDYKLLETYKFASPAFVTEGFITAFFCDDDDLVSLNAFRCWGHFCQGEFTLHKFPGHHFFINNNYPKICAIIREQLQQLQLSNVIVN